MNISGNILKVVADGYERLATLRTGKKELTFSYLDYANFVKDESSINTPTTLTYGEAKLKLLMAVIDCVTPFKEGLIEQPIEGSPHTILAGTIRQIEDEELTVAIAGFGELEVEFESEMSVDVGSKVCIKGELNSESGLN